MAALLHAEGQAVCGPPQNAYDMAVQGCEAINGSAEMMMYDLQMHR